MAAAAPTAGGAARLARACRWLAARGRALVQHRPPPAPPLAALALALAGPQHRALAATAAAAAAKPLHRPPHTGRPIVRLRARFQRPQHTGQGFELQIGRHTMPAVGLLGHGGPVLRGCQCLQLGGPAAVLLHATLQHVLPSSPVAPQGHGGGRIPGRCIGCGQHRRCRAGGCSHCAGPGSRRQGQAQHPGHFRVQVGDMQGLGGKAIHPRLQG